MNNDDIDNLNDEDIETRERKRKELDKIIVGTFETELGQKCLEILERAFINRPMYVQGLSPDQVAYRQGQCDVIRHMIKSLEEAKNGR